MIYNLTIKNPKRTPLHYWEKVPFLNEPKTIEFQPGLNILFGPNGSGKSTLLNGLAVLMHCKDENWPRVSKPSIVRFNRPNGLADGLMLEHDGEPARYLGLEQPLDFTPDKGVENVELAFSSPTAEKAAGHQSAGQATLSALSRFLRAVPQRTKYSIKAASISEEWVPVYKVATAALKNKKPRAGMPKQQVILLDEFDRSLDFTKQAVVWKQISLLAATGKYQIIIASHSPFAVNVPKAHYVETDPGYLESSRKALAVLLRGVAA